MQPPPPGVLSAIFDAIGSGLPHLLTQLVASIALLGIGVAIYTALTPFRERALMSSGNVAAGVVFAGAVVALVLPIATILATSGRLLDVIVWGVVALTLQLITLGTLALSFRNMSREIESGNVAVALGIAAAQVAVALLNAAAMIPI
jgi:putative membrane protein